LGQAKNGENVLMANLKKIGDLFVLLGGIVGIIQGVLMFLPGGGYGYDFISDYFVGMEWLVGILAILFSFIVLVNSGFIKISALDFGKKNKFVVVLIVSILMIVAAATWGGLLALLGVILWML
jgi:hypothetical protein